MSENNQYPQRPVKVFRAAHRLELAIWARTIDMKGRKALRHSCRLEKQYRNRDGKYEKTDVLFVDDLPRVSLLANKAYEWITLREADEVVKVNS